MSISGNSGTDSWQNTLASDSFAGGLAARNFEGVASPVSVDRWSRSLIIMDCPSDIRFGLPVLDRADRKLTDVYRPVGSLGQRHLRLNRHKA